MKKIKTAIIGTGNIGTDLLMKLKKSKVLEVSMFTGIDKKSEGIKIARSMGIATSTKSIEAIVKNPGCCDIVFDATSAKIHLMHAPILKKLGKFTIDLTPAKVGSPCIPVLNIKECLNEDNVNLITCAGQATVPIVYAITKTHPKTQFVEISVKAYEKSFGPATMANMDKAIKTTKNAIVSFAKVPKVKIKAYATAVKIAMTNTIYARINRPDIAKIRRAVSHIEKKINAYVPGYKVILKPTKEKGGIKTVVEVEGAGDFLPKYAGNLDIITCAAVKVAEEYVGKILKKQCKNKEIRAGK
jgi:acetaldehyde dehydrogenase